MCPLAGESCLKTKYVVLQGSCLEVENSNMPEQLMCKCCIAMRRVKEHTLSQIRLTKLNTLVGRQRRKGLKISDDLR